ERFFPYRSENIEVPVVEPLERKSERPGIILVRLRRASPHAARELIEGDDQSKLHPSQRRHDHERCTHKGVRCQYPLMKGVATTNTAPSAVDVVAYHVNRFRKRVTDLSRAARLDCRHRIPPAARPPAGSWTSAPRL